MIGGYKTFEPLLKRRLFARIFKGVFVTAGFIFITGMIFLAWAFRTGRAVESVRQQIVTGLHDECDLEASFTSLSVDPIGREIALADLSLRHLDGRPLLSMKAALVSVRLLPLFYGRLQLDRVAVLEPEATLELAGSRLLNLPRCIPQDSSDADPPVVFGIRELTVERGRFNLKVDDKAQIRLADIGVSLTESRKGGMDLALGVDDGGIHYANIDHVLKGVRLLGHLEGLLSKPRAIVVHDLRAGLDRVTAGGHGSIDLLGPVFDAQLDVSAPLEAISDFLPEAPAASGQLTLAVAVAGTILEPRASGRLVVENGHVADLSLADKVSVDFAVDRKGVKLPAIGVDIGSGHANIKAEIKFDEKKSMWAESDGSDISLARVLDSIGITGPWVDLRATGRSGVKGTLDPLRIEGPFDYEVRDLYVYNKAYDHPDGRELMLNPANPLHAKGTWRFTPIGVEFIAAKVTGPTAEADADVKMAFDTKVGLDLKASFSHFDFAELGPIAGLPFTGAGVLSGVMYGPLATVQAEGRFDLIGAGVADIPLGEAKGSVHWKNIKDLELRDITGKLGESHYSGRVGVTLEGEVPLQITGEIPDGRLQDLLIPFKQESATWGEPKGKMKGHFDLVGPVQKLTGPIEMDLEQIVAFDEKAESGRVNGRFEQGRLIADDLEIRKHGARIIGGGFIEPRTGLVGLELRSKEAKLQHLDLVANGLPLLTSDLDLRLGLKGSLKGVTGTVALVLDDLRAGTVQLGGARFDGRIAGSILNLVGGLDDSRMTASGAIELRAGLPYKGTIELAELDAARLVSGLQGHERWSGSAVLEAKLSGSLVDWRRSSGSLAVERADFDGGSFKIATSAPARFSLKEGVLETKRIALAGPRTRLVADGRLGGSIVDLQVNGKIDLGLVELTSPSVEKAGGSLTLDGAISGTPYAMNLVGTGRIEGGVLQWRGIENRLTAVSADLTFSQSSVLVERAEGRWAGGMLEASGSVSIDKLMPKSISLDIGVDAVRPRLSLSTTDLSAQLDGSLHASGSLEKLWVRGKLDVRNGLARPKIDYQDLVGRRRPTAAYDPTSERTEFEIALHTIDSFRIKNDIVDVEADGDVRLTGTNERFGMLGNMTVVPGGRVSGIGRDYVMQQGLVEFTERYRWEPGYDLALTSEACSAVIRLNLVGTLEKVETTYSSNPEMGDSDIFSCLTRGVKSRYLDQDLVTAAGSALIKLSGVDRQVKKVIPVDQIDVTTEFSSQSRAYEPRVLVAKDLSVLNRPVRLEYSSSLLRTNDQRAALKVRLTPRLNLQLGWTSSEDVPYGDWGLDLKQRWEW